MIVENEQMNDMSSFLNYSEKGSDCIVFQLGSHSIKFGLASQFTPLVIPNVIAHQLESFNENDMINDNTNEDGDNDIRIEMQIDDDYSNNNKENTKNNRTTHYEINDTFLSNLLNIEQETIKRLLKLEQKLKIKKQPNPNTKTLKNYDSTNCELEVVERKNFEYAPKSSSNFKKMYGMSLDINEDIPDNNYKWTSVQDLPRHLIGREALNITELSRYEIRYPIKNGMFNDDYSHQGVIDDIYKIIEYCLTSVLKINRKEYNNYNILLIIPDLFIKQQVKGLINIFLRDFGFKNILTHTESVMSAFGAALQSSCVVDIGSSKTNVCCIEEGMIIEESLIRKNFGGDDITKFLYMMLMRNGNNNNNSINKQNYFPIEYFDINNPYHFRIIEKLKETELECPSIQNPSSQFLSKNAKLWLHRKHKPTKVFNITMTESAYIPPLGLFYPEIFDSFRNVTIPHIGIYNDIYSELYTDPEDIMDDLIKTLINAPNSENKKEEKDEKNIILNNLHQSSVKKSKNGDDLEESGSASPSRSDENSSQIYEDQKFLGKKNTYESMYKSISLEDMICQSIMSVTSSDLRKRLANSILFVGGGVKFKGLIDYVEDRLIDKLTTLDNEIDRVEIINFPTLDAKTLTWIGGTIIPKLESSKDMWIAREKWLGEVERIEDVKDLITISGNKEIKDNSSNVNDNESKKESEKGREKAEKEKLDRVKKKERHLDGGVKLLREKSAYNW